ncbi:MAG: DUF4185 domain-containing protein [Defluviitaleaceae bacterium]|nr:DUF4185 domain-containing protein [Defluviitaleaceae bacterium]
MKFPRPNYPKSTFIKGITFDKYRLHKGNGDMWPSTWADDDNLYTASGDIPGSVLNFWKVTGIPHFAGLSVDMVNFTPIDPEYAKTLPETHPKNNLKPAGVIYVNGRMYMSVSSMNYAEPDYWYRQRYPNSWIITSDDYGKTWDTNATPYNFFSGGLCGSTFVQFGKNNAGARDEYVYACFPCSYDRVSYWENADILLMGRVPSDKILVRDAWEFYIGNESWSSDGERAIPIFEYPKMTGQDFIQYNPGLKRYIMGNYSFTTEEGVPRPYHQGDYTGEYTRYPSQLSLFEAPEPWGPWSIFHMDDNWGTYGGYQPSFPVKWMSDDGLTMHMVSSGSFDDYNFTVQKVMLEQ